jgi:hypothetical protein
VQPAIAELAALMCQIAQLLAQLFVACPTRLVTDDRPVRRNHPARPPFADIKQGLKMRYRFPLGGRRYHFLIADPSDLHCPASRSPAAA